MPTPARTKQTARRPTARRAKSAARKQALRRIAVGVNGYPEGRDAAVLGEALAQMTDADLMLVAVHAAPLLPAKGWDWRSLRKEAEHSLREVRDACAPDARILTRTDSSVPRALQRVVGRERCDLLVVGSAREAPDGQVRIGKRARQLLCHFGSALAVAPHGMHSRPEVAIKRIGVGYDAGREADAALALAAAIARAGEAQLVVRGVVDDRVPILLRSAIGGLVKTEWADVIAEEEQRLHEHAVAVAKKTGASVDAAVVRGRPADALLSLSRDVDLLVIGSRRWGPTARVLLGSTGEALMLDAACPVLAVPRPTGR